MKWRVILAFLLGMAPAFGADPDVATTLIVGQAYVVDGDTLRMSGTRDYIRLWGIDAPELKTPEGRSARTFLGRMVSTNVIRCVPKDRDRYDRIVAMCFLGSEDIAAVMVRAGQARDWPRYSHGYYAK